VFTFDIDMSMIADLAELVTDVSPNGWSPQRIALRRAPAIALPWHHAIATSSYFPATDASRRYLGLVCDYLQIFGHGGSSHRWWIDQNALFFPLLMTDQSDFQRWDGALRARYAAYPKDADKDQFFLDQAKRDGEAAA
jgi:hypothetical protein